MKKVSFLLILLLLFPTIALAGPKGNNSKYSGSLLNNSTIFSLDGNKSLFVDKMNNELQVVDISSQKSLWKKKFSTIYDCDVLANPFKIVIITAKNNKVEKVTLSTDGKLLSQQVLSNLKIEDNQFIRWFPAQNKEKEKVALSNKGSILIYQYPWKKPISKLRINQPNEYVVTVLNDIQLHYPYVIIKHLGNNSPQDQEVYRIINVSTKKEITIPVEWNVTSNFVVEGNQLVINTSSIIGFPMGINPGDKVVYSRYNLKTGLLETKVTRKFDNSVSNWRTDYVNQQLLLVDSEQNKQTLYNKSGQILVETVSTAENLEYKFIGYKDKKIFSLVPSVNNKNEVEITITNTD